MSQSGALGLGVIDHARRVGLGVSTFGSVGKKVDISGNDLLESAAHAMAERLRRSGLEAEGFLVQRMAGEGVEMIVGVVQDPQFGAVIACGAGDTAVE